MLKPYRDRQGATHEIDSNSSFAFKKLFKRLGLEHLTFHGLRVT